MNRKIVAGILLLAALFAGLAVVRLSRQHGSAGHAEQAALYYCPMHPTYTSDRPGECPICHMQLVPLEKRTGSPTGLVKREKSAQAKEPESLCTLHNCPMVHDGRPCPMLVVSKPGEEVSCPICGTHVTGEGEEGSPSSAVSAQGYAAVLLSPQKRQLIGIKTSPARKQPLAKKIRAVGLVKVDETRIKHVHPKVEGWIDEIFAKYEGDKVRKGQPLFSFHSPDFLSAQKEYLTTLESLAGMPETIASEVRMSVRSNLEAARQRLLWWGVTQEQIEALEKSRTPSHSVRLSSPIDGVVLKKHVWPGEYMERGADFYHIVDLSSVWVDIALYEMDLPLVSPGQEAVVEWPSRLGELLRGKLIYVAQLLNPETRTATARLELSNPDGLLRPDQYVTAEISVDLGERLVVPAEAVLDSGTRQLLFVDKGEGLLEPREVTVGVRGNGLWEIIRGVSEGESVVVNGNFLVDSESRLKAALEGAGSQRHQHGQ